MPIKPQSFSELFIDSPSAAAESIKMAKYAPVHYQRPLIQRVLPPSWGTRTQSWAHVIPSKTRSKLFPRHLFTVSRHLEVHNSQGIRWIPRERSFSYIYLYIYKYISHAHDLHNTQKLRGSSVQRTKVVFLQCVRVCGCARACRGEECPVPGSPTAVP